MFNKFNKTLNKKDIKFVVFQVYLSKLKNYNP